MLSPKTGVSHQYCHAACTGNIPLYSLDHYSPWTADPYSDCLLSAFHCKRTFMKKTRSASRCRLEFKVDAAISRLAIKDTLVCRGTFLRWRTFMGFEYLSRIWSVWHVHSFIFIWTLTHVKLSLYIWIHCCIDWWQLSDFSCLLECFHIADLHHLK